MKEQHFNKSNLALIMTYQEFMEINRVYLEYTERNFPNVPTKAIVPVEKRLNTKSIKSLSQLLQRCIIDYTNWKYGKNIAKRINSMGIPFVNKKTNQIIWRKNPNNEIGASDVRIHFKPTWHVEVKIKDSQLDTQKEFQSKVEAKGEIYFIVRNMTDFFKQLNK